jgi:SpoVK/Ycf46/Vps4 family AAA+-type ATPase
MYTELLRIIEGGLSKDTQKVYNYSKMLANKMSRDGEPKMSKMILDSLERNYLPMLSLDELSSTPTDTESRLSIVDVYYPSENEITPILSELSFNKVDDFVNMIKHQGDLYKNGIESNCSLMLYGAPGCGKSTIAKYIAKQIDLPLVIARLDALVSSLLGSTSKNIRKLFDFAASRPCILFLDEFDAIAKARDDQHELGELKRVINSLLQNIDSLSSSSILIAATNHADLLDKAIWRRFHTILEIDLPVEKEIKKMLKYFIGDFKTTLPLEDDQRMSKIVKAFSDSGKLSPADIQTIVNNAKVQVIIKSDSSLSVEDLLVQLFDFNNHDNGNIENLVKYLSDNGISQCAISNRLNISIRQIKNILNKEDNHG